MRKIQKMPKVLIVEDDELIAKGMATHLVQKIWGRRLTRRDRTVDVFVRKLREKIDARTPRHAFVHTRYGVGYKLEAQPKVGPSPQPGENSVRRS
jgi:DNA-binding winged helix-turn-helix (wHTH) protein